MTPNGIGYEQLRGLVRTFASLPAGRQVRNEVKILAEFSG
jgi:hypothetical protein